MSEPSLELQKAVIAKLRADPAVTALVVGRIYDAAPTDRALQYPYTTLGPGETLPRDADGYRGSEIHMQIDTWSTKTGFPETKSLTGAIRAALHYAEDLALTGHRLVQIRVDAVRELVDPDGATKHGVVSVVAITEPV